MVDRQIRPTHFEYDIVKKGLLPFRMEVLSLVSYLVQLPCSFLYPFFSRDKNCSKLGRLLARPRFAVARVVDHACVVTYCQNSRLATQYANQVPRVIVRRMKGNLVVFFVMPCDLPIILLRSTYWAPLT